MEEPYLLELCHGGRRINNGFYMRDNTLRLSKGEVIAVIGKNGSGKSALLGMLMGILPLENGEICIEGQSVELRTPADAAERGLILLGQNQPLFDNMRVYENIYFGRELTFQNRGRLLDDRRMREEARELFSRMGIPIDIMVRLQQLNQAQRQLVGLARAVSAGARLLLLDEPSTHLSGAEKGELWNALHALKAQGSSVLLVSHDPEEVLATADRLYIMENGTLGEARPTTGMTSKDVIEAAYGIRAEELYRRKRMNPGSPVLTASHLCGKVFTDVTISLHGGEVIGLMGTADSGARSLLRALGGFEEKLSGTLRGRDRVTPGQPITGLEQGISLALGDEEDAILKECERLLRQGRKNTASTRMHLGLTLFGASISQMFGGWMGTRSATQTHVTGGNYRGELIERAISRRAEAFLLCDPTAGMDALARMRVYQRIGRLVTEGAGILMLTGSIEEALGFCDRLLVMRGGKLVLDAPIQGEKDALRAQAEALLNPAL